MIEAFPGTMNSSPLSLSLTSSQQGILAASLVDPASNELIVGDVLFLNGSVCIKTLRLALERALEETPALSLRLSPDEKGNEERTLVPGNAPTLNHHDLCGQEQPLEAAWERIWAIRDQGVHLEDDCLTRIDTFSLGTDSLGTERIAVSLLIHHILMDGYALTLFIKRILHEYARIQDPSRPAPRPWGDLEKSIEEENFYRDSPAFLDDERYWREHQPSPEAVTGFSPHKQPAASGSSRLSRIKRPLPLNAASLEESASALGVTFVDLFLAAHALTLSSSSGSDNIVIGLPLMNRSRPSLALAPTSVVNVLPLALDLNPSQNLRELLNAIQTARNCVRKHGRYPAEKLLVLHGHHERGSSPTGTELNIKMFGELPPLKDIDVQIENIAEGPVSDLCLSVTMGHQPQWSITAPSNYYQEELSSFLDRLDTVLLGICSSSGQESLATLPLGPTVSLSQSPNFPGRAPLLHERLQENSRQHPDTPALVHRGKSLTHSELWERIQLLGAELIEHTERNQIILLDLPRNLEAICWLFATISSGRTAVPLDQGWPEDRKEGLREHLRRSSIHEPLLLDEHAAGQLSARALARTLRAAKKSEGKQARPVSSDPAYIIHTSGSTGAPKPVAISQGSLGAHLRTYGEHMWAGSTPRMAALTLPLVFDGSWDMLSAVTWGWCVHLVDHETAQDPKETLGYLREQGITSIDSTPTIIQALLDEGLLEAGHCLAQINVGGEACPSALWNTLSKAPGIVARNYYGPTESTVDATRLCSQDTFRADLQAMIQRAESSGSSIIGVPVEGTHAYILDSALRPLPLGVSGELYLSGPQLATGYLGMPAKTAERFLPCPFADPGERMYRTGDTVRMLPGGVLAYEGRSDAQVKIRGYRVEPGEIESVLCSLEGVRQAIVRVKDGQLLAWVLSSRPGQQLLEEACERLPSHLLPHAVISLQAYPRTNTGKIDVSALARPELKRSGRPPHSIEEKALCEQLGRLLGIETIFAEDQFFGLGGDSILAIRLVAALAREGWDCSVSTIFSEKSVEKISARIRPLQAQRPLTRAAMNDEQHIASVTALLAKRRARTQRRKNA